MENNISKKHWENVYATKSPQEVSWFQTEPVISLKIIQRLAGHHASIIDIGCGASTLVDYMLQLGYTNLAVLDISRKALAIVKKRLAEQENAVEWHECDITAFTPAHTYDIWHDRAVFHFLTSKASRKAYKSVLLQSTQSGSYAIIATFAKDGPKKCSGLDIMQHDIVSIRQEFGDAFILQESLLETHRTPSGSEQHFIYFVLQRTTSSQTIGE